jgi:hypothetical protein
VTRVEPSGDTDQVGTGEVERIRSGLHLVVEGHLNPAILVPGWFRREGLLRDEEVDAAEANLSADSSFVAFRTGDFSFVVSLDRLEVFSNHEGLEPVLRDLVLNVFTLLRHTPLTSLTISRSAHLANSLDASDAPEWTSLISYDPFEPVLGRFVPVDVSARSTEGPVPEGSEVVLSVQPSRDKNASLFIECRYTYPLAGDDSAELLNDRLKNAMETTRSHSDAAFVHFARLLLGTRA